MKSERNRIGQIVLTGFLVGLCFVMICFWGDTSLRLLGWSEPLGQRKFTISHTGSSYKDFDLVRILGDARPPDPNIAVSASPKLRVSNWATRPDFLSTRLFQPFLWGTEYLQRHMDVVSQTVTFKSKEKSYSIRWDAGSGLLVKERIEKEQEGDARVTPVAYIGPKGMGENAGVALGRFHNPRLYRYDHRDELFICDAGLSKFYLADMQEEAVVSIKKLDRSLVDMGSSILVKGGDLLRFRLDPARRWETDQEMEKRYKDSGNEAIEMMGMYYGEGNPWAPNVPEVDPNLVIADSNLVILEVPKERSTIALETPKIQFAIANSDPWVLDDLGAVYSLNRERLAWVPMGGLPRCGVQVTSDPSQLLAYRIAPIYVDGSCAGFAAASLSKDAREYAVALYDAAGERVGRDRIEFSPEYFKYAHIATAGRAALNFVQPLAFSLAATFWGPRCEASASYRALVVSPFSIPARLASDVHMDWQDRYGTLIMWNVLIMSFGLLLGIAVMQDAKRQGIAAQTATRWCYACIPLGLIAFFTYVIRRPRIRRVTCANCGNTRRPDQAQCHQCGIDWDMPELQVPAWRVTA